MQAICSFALMLTNSAYLFIYFNMDLMVLDASEEQIEEVVVLSANPDFDPTDILDLDILDFDIEELMDRKGDASAVLRPHLVHDRV
jgi:hypothetical protein